MTEPATAPPELALAARLFDALRAASLDPPGVSRASYGPGERAAHTLLRTTAESLGLEIATDHAGNLYMTLPGRDRAAPAVIMGSHLDAVPHGGNFDGAAGVVAGIAALARLRRLGRTPRQDVTVMGIRAEEMSWFPAPYIGSRAAFGLLPAEVLDTTLRFDSGRTLASHMAEEGFDPEAVRAGRAWLDPARIGAYIEVHIEQGPHLVRICEPAAIVTGIRGNIRYKHCRVLGQYGHAGGVQRKDRRDAVMAAVEFIHALEADWIADEAAGRDLVATVGQLYTDAEHHTITKIPGEVRFTMDIRSYDDECLQSIIGRLDERARAISDRRGVAIDLGAHAYTPAAVMNPGLISQLEAAAAAAGLAVPKMGSGAGHDCLVFSARGVPCAMVFIRNDKGSHNALEEMEIADFGVALTLLDGLLDRITA
jgi:N-carbamoyl-L-amino-acid hydrolase